VIERAVIELVEIRRAPPRPRLLGELDLISASLDHRGMRSLIA